MSQPARRPASYADIEALPDNVVGEIIAGDLVTSPRPSFSHAAVATGIAAALAPPFQYGDGGPGGWWILVEPELHLGDDIVVPDLAGWRRERLPDLAGVTHTEIVPDWVCEILSPRTGQLDRAHKMPLYARCGVRHMWTIDPAIRTLEILQNEGARWTIVATQSGSAVVRAVPFEEASIALAKWWGQPTESIRRSHGWPTL